MFMIASLFVIVMSCSNRNAVLSLRGSFISRIKRGISTLTPAKSCYELIDCGAFRKLERFGDVIIDRACPAARWPKSYPNFWKSQGILRSAPNTTTGDEAPWAGPAPNNWQFKWNSVCLALEPSNNGQQIGIFPEHMAHWRWLQSILEAESRQRRQHCVNQSLAATAVEPIKVLNCFAYTGAATLASVSVDGVQVLI